MTNKDSEKRREFDSGSVRDIVNCEGRFDLVPLVEVGEMIEYAGLDTNIARVLKELGYFVYTANCDHLYGAAYLFIQRAYNGDYAKAILDVAKHYEEGCEKYGERNWEKEIPLHSFVDSAVRHLIKYWLQEDDENHDRAFLWNVLCAAHTLKFNPMFNDLPVVSVEESVLEPQDAKFAEGTLDSLKES